MKKLLFLIFALGPFFKLYANARNCLILPVNLATYDSDIIFNNIEKYIKRSNWCVYQNSSQLFDILKPFSDKGKNYLENLEVLELISKKSDSQSIIHIDEFTNQLRIRVFDGTSNPVFAYSKKLDDIKNIEDATTIIKQALENYGKLIPYDMIVLGRNLDVLTVSAGSEFGITRGDSVYFLKDLKRVNHPLYKFAVDYSYQKFCHGIVLQSDYGMSIVEINSVEEKSCSNVTIGSYLKKEKIVDNFKKLSFKKQKNKIFQIVPSLSISSATLSINNSEQNNLTGLSSNISSEIFAKLTTNYFFLTKIKIGLSFLSNDNSGFEDQTPLLSDLQFGGRYKVKSLKNTDLNFDLSVRFTDVFLTEDSENFISPFGQSSLYLLTNLNHQFSKKITGTISLGFSLYSIGSMDNELLGDIESSSVYEGQVGIWFEKNKDLKLYGGVNLGVMNLNFSGENKNMEFSELSLLTSMQFNF